MNPKQVKLKNRIYNINTDFRVWVNVERLLQDDNLTIDEKIEHLFKLIYLEDIQLNLYSEAFEMAIYFYNVCIINEPSPTKKEEPEDVNKLYCYVSDKNYIKATFMSVYNFDPWQSSYLHWWDFKAYFEGLFGLNFENILNIRQTDINEFKGNARLKIARLKEQFKLKDKAELAQEKYNKTFDEFINSGGTISEYDRLYN